MSIGGCLKLIDKYLTHRNKVWFIRLFALAGIGMITPNFWLPILEFWTEIKFPASIYKADLFGWVFILISLLLYFTEKLTQYKKPITLINLGLVLLALIFLISYITFINFNTNTALANNPQFKLDSEILSVTWGSNTLQTNREYLKNRAPINFPIQFSDVIPPKIYVENDKLFVDVIVPSKQHFPGIKIKKNVIYGLPSNWDWNYNNNAVEIVNEDGLPMYQLIYKNQNHIILYGYFPTNKATVFADKNGIVGNPTGDYNFNLDKIFKYPSWKYPSVLAD
ncbi:MAG: hypothetical protein H6912_00630 [Kordiimonadaceae bacterium]|nr:hypothetical protein [Kordiimonadaceae bacterium]